MILAVTGLEREARLIRGPGVRAFAGGGRPQAALEAALLAVAQGAEAIISIGLAGALAPGLQPGDWVVADSVAWPGGDAPADPRWSAALAVRLGARKGAFLSSDEMLTRAADKADAGRRWDAVAVDMESRAAALVAQKLSLPFAAARVISDAADVDLPDAVRVGMRPDGRMAGLAVLLALLRRPGDIPALARTAVAAGRAFRALADGRRLLGPRLGLADLGQLALDVG